MSNPAWEMRRALRLAEKGRGRVLPNPLVGAVLVKEGERIGEGWHEHFGSAHAEVNALESCRVSPDGATLYVTLEPCCHHGKTPPCTEAIIKSGIQNVVVATLDPSEKVHGKGVEALRNAGLKVEVGLLEDEARELNREFFTFHEKKRPFVTLKAALSLDGKIAKNRTEETVLTGSKAQKRVHELRRDHQAILVGAGTVFTDDPHLGVRLVDGPSPLRVILEGKRKIPKTAQVFRDDNILVLKNQKIQGVLELLYKNEVVSVLVEGGQDVFNSFLESGAVDELKFFYAPVILGEKAVPFTTLEKDFHFRKTKLEELGPDWLVTLTSL